MLKTEECQKFPTEQQLLLTVDKLDVKSGEQQEVINTHQMKNYFSALSPCGRFVASSGQKVLGFFYLFIFFNLIFKYKTNLRANFVKKGYNFRFSSPYLYGQFFQITQIRFNLITTLYVNIMHDVYKLLHRFSMDTMSC